MTQFAYIFDTQYRNALTQVVNFIDENKCWDIYTNMEYGSELIVPTELFDGAGGIANNLELNQQIELLQDIKFMGKFTNKQDRDINFKHFYCSSRLFDYMDSAHDKKMCQIAYNAIVQAEGWDYLKTFEPNPSEGFAFTSDNRMQRLMDKVAQADNSHSGCSMGFTMRILEQIARTGLV
jgi:hypothetical protein